MPAIRLGDIAKLVEGHVNSADMDIMVSAINTLAKANADEISFLANAHYKQEVEHTAAAAVLISDAWADEVSGSAVFLRVKDPYLAFAKLQRFFYPQVKASGQRHASACIDVSAKLAEDVDVAAGCVIESGVFIAAGTRLSAGCIIGEGVHIGHDCLLHAGVKVASGCMLGDRVILQAGAVLGSDGFGYAWSGSEHLKIPQVGRVILHDDVEIGANSCIDRGALGDTVIQQGVKLDNLIQIGHNVEVGALTVMASQVGISGSTKIGQGCQIGGQAGTAGHLTIADGCQLAARTGVMSDLQAGGVYAGMPAMPHRHWLKTSVLINRLPEIWKKFKVLP
ncbi:MAG: UDP-3-O-(3-hydroxymyristoyl)glucosamine N-acyltransferase [Mariprofundaceae bacterium]